MISFGVFSKPGTLSEIHSSTNNANSTTPHKEADQTIGINQSINEFPGSEPNQFHQPRRSRQIEQLP